MSELKCYCGKSKMNFKHIHEGNYYAMCCAESGLSKEACVAGLHTEEVEVAPPIFNDPDVSIPIPNAEGVSTIIEIPNATETVTNVELSASDVTNHDSCSTPDGDSCVDAELSLVDPDVLADAKPTPKPKAAPKKAAPKRRGRPPAKKKK